LIDYVLYDITASMERCKAPGMIGVICRRIPGTNIKSCYAYQEWLADPAFTVEGLRESAPGCEFVKSGQVPPTREQNQPPAPATK
jgi:hypothetical protein